MSANPDFKDLFSVFNAENVEYLVVGAHAVIFYAEPRYTKDLDVWVNPSPANAARVWRALGRFGAPLTDISKHDFLSPETVYPIGIEPNRIDVLMGLGDIDFRQALANCSNHLRRCPDSGDWPCGPRDGKTAGWSPQGSAGHQASSDRRP